MEDESTSQKLDIESAVQKVLGTIEREREREIVSRRFGLFDRRETLEQIGELLGITTERVRQLEKAVVTRLRASAEKDLADIKTVESVFTTHLNHMGKVARISDVSQRLSKTNSK